MCRGSPSKDVVTTCELAFQECINPNCRQRFGVSEVHVHCSSCGSLLDIGYEWDRVPVPRSLTEFEAKWSRRGDPLCLSGVWRFHELLPFAERRYVTTIGEGQTLLGRSERAAGYVGVAADKLFLQYEGLNPSGSFKDNGMTAAFTHANMVGAERAACASTGNTSASLAVFCAAHPRTKAIIFIGSGKIAYGKLAQALDHGALTIQIAGDFDDAMLRVQQVTRQLGMYLVNSVNAFRLEGQKAIMYRVLEGLAWQPPDWIVVPGGNLGNSSAFGKAFIELRQLGLIGRIPRLAIINAAGANTLYQLVEERGLRWNDGQPDPLLMDSFFAEMDATRRRAQTIASAIEINRPVNLPKALRALAVCDGVVREVTDQEILDAKAIVGAGGLGCEPASAASVAGARLLCRQGVIAPSESVVCVLTGHPLKDPSVPVAYHSGDRALFDQVLSQRGVKRASFANRPVQVANDLTEIINAIALNS